MLHWRDLYIWWGPYWCSRCTLKKVILALMFWSDSTHLANFGTTKVWPLHLLVDWDLILMWHWLLTCYMSYSQLKQVQMHTLTGMLMFWGSSMPKSCILAPILQTTPHNIWSFYGFDDLVKYLVTGSVWRLHGCPKWASYPKKMIWHSVFWIHPSLFRDVILCHHFLKDRWTGFSLLRLQLLGFPGMFWIGWHAMSICKSSWLLPCGNQFKNPIRFVDWDMFMCLLRFIWTLFFLPTLAPLWLISLMLITHRSHTYSTMTHISHTYDSSFPHLLHHDSYLLCL